MRVIDLSIPFSCASLVLSQSNTQSQWSNWIITAELINIKPPQSDNCVYNSWSIVYFEETQTKKYTDQLLAAEIHSTQKHAMCSLKHTSHTES